MMAAPRVDHRPCTAQRHAWVPLEQERRELAMERREHKNRKKKVADLVGLFRSMNRTAAEVARMTDEQRMIAVQIKIAPNGAPVSSGRAAELPSEETWGMVVAEMVRGEAEVA